MDIMQWLKALVWLAAVGAIVLYGAKLVGKAGAKTPIG